jgi:serine/threonine protein kinase
MKQRRFADNVCQAVRHLHLRCQMAHRDISLENFFQRTDGTLVLGDFELATTKLCVFDYVGKPQYLAPEVRPACLNVPMRGYNPFHSDVWAVAIVLFFIFVGVPPFSEPSAQDVYYATIVKNGIFARLRLDDLDADQNPASAWIPMLEQIFQSIPTKRPSMQDLCANLLLKSQEKITRGGGTTTATMEIPATVPPEIAAAVQNVICNYLRWPTKFTCDIKLDGGTAVYPEDDKCSHAMQNIFKHWFPTIPTPVLQQVVFYLKACPLNPFLA